MKHLPDLLHFPVRGKRRRLSSSGKSWSYLYKYVLAGVNNNLSFCPLMVHKCGSDLRHSWLFGRLASSQCLMMHRNNVSANLFHNTFSVKENQFVKTIGHICTDFTESIDIVYSYVTAVLRNAVNFLKLIRAASWVSRGPKYLEIRLHGQILFTLPRN